MKTNEVEEIETIFNSKGIVLGNLWGGGLGTYPSVQLKGFFKKEDLIKEAERKLEEGSLDSGMGFEKLIGAILIIETKNIIKYENQLYENINHEDEIIGKMTLEELNLLYNSLNSW